MATLSGHRIAVRAAAAAAALLSAALTVGAGPAYAAPQEVDFSGGSVLTLLVCKSTPSTDELTLTEGAKVVFVNRLGESASLKVNGDTVSDVPPNNQVTVHFTSPGDQDVSMAFDCGVGVVQEFKSVSVAVNAADPAPAPAKQQQQQQPQQQAPAAPPAATTGGVGALGAPTAAVPTRTSGGTARHASAAPTGRTGTGAASGATATPGATGTAGSTGGIDGTSPIGPALVGGDGLDPSSSAAAADGSGGGQGNGVYVEAAVPASGPGKSGSTGLLALIASVCVVGVGMAAIRAIIAQRSVRTNLT